MIYTSIADTSSIVFAPLLVIKSLEFDQKLCENFTKTSDMFHNGCMTLTSFHAVCETGEVIHMAGKFKITFFRYQFMNLIFSYISKRGRGGLLERGARRNSGMCTTLVIHISLISNPSAIYSHISPISAPST